MCFDAYPINAQKETQIKVYAPSKEKKEQNKNYKTSIKFYWLQSIYNFIKSITL